ncbi:hypothetical protein Tco_0787202, partial [Tanacetum coccineum]
SQFLVTTHHERENSPPEVVVVNDNCGVNNAYLFGQKNSPAHFTTTNGITLDVRYDFVVIHSVKAADGDDMEDPELTLLAKGLEQQSSFRSYVVIIASLRSNEEDKMNEISHLYQKLKSFYNVVLNLGPEYVQDAKMEEWLIRGHISVHEME